MFDPDKVERLYHTIGGNMEVSESKLPGNRFVRASDYDQLLALYREANNRLESITAVVNLSSGHTVTISTSNEAQGE